MSVLLFDDTFVDLLRPITWCRPACSIQCGGLRLIDLVTSLGIDVAIEPRPYLKDMVREDFPSYRPREAVSRRILVNSRLVPSAGLVETLQWVFQSQQSGAVWHGDQLALAILLDPIETTVQVSEIPSYVRELNLPPVSLSDEMLEKLALFDYPFTVMAKHRSTLNDSLRYRLNADSYREICEGVFAKDDTIVDDCVVTDTSRGPILVGSNSRLGAFSHLTGPIFIDDNVTIRPQATLHSHVSIGRFAKVGGEVESSIIESYSNKQHHGYIGHSYVGSWVNLGAGTSNSNLKNTYGPIKMLAGGEKISTNMRLMGCIIGDHTKTAINTSILTGLTVGVGSMLYGFVAEDVPCFVNYAKQFGDVSAVSLESALTVQQRMYARRNVSRQSDGHVLRTVYEDTAPDRTGLECRPPRLVK